MNQLISPNVDTSPRLQIIHLVNDDFGPSAMMEAVLKSVVRLRPNYSFKQLPIVDAQHLVQTLGVRNVPSVLILRDGVAVAQFRGLMSRKKLCALLDEVRLAPPAARAS